MLKSLLQGLILFFFYSGICQSLQEKVSCEELKEEVIRAYSERKTLCYRFAEKRYSKDFPVNPLVSRGSVMWYREGDSVFYKGTHTYDLALFKDVKFETVKNKLYFGTNFFKESFFRDYASLPEKKRYYAYRNSPKDILTDQTLNTVFRDTLFYMQTEVFEEYDVLRFIDTNRRSFTNVDGKRLRTEKRYYVSKKDQSILKSTLHTFWRVGDLEKSDSVVYTYEYRNLPYKKIRDSVESFISLGAKKPEIKNILQDSITYFPEFHLPDISGKIKEVNALYVLVDFWYKGCAPCLANMKKLDKITSKNVQVVTINVRDSIDQDIRQIISKHDYIFLFNGQELMKQLNVQAFPTMYLYDARRKILHKHVGVGVESEMSELIDKLIADK